MQAINKIMWTEMTRPELEMYLNNKSNPVVIIPFGAIEQHGVHLPLGTDSLSAIEICKAIAKKTDSLVLPLTWVGYSEQHMGFKGTITFSQDTLARIISDTIRCLSCHGLKRILIVNFHGGNTDIINFAVNESSRKYKVNIITNSPEIEDSEDTLKNYDFHAGKGETSFMLHLFPELVDTDKMKEWKPTMNFPKPVAEARKLCLERNENRQHFLKIAMSYTFISDTHEITSSGTMGIEDIKYATKEEGKKFFDNLINKLVNLIRLWDEMVK